MPTPDADQQQRSRMSSSSPTPVTASRQPGPGAGSAVASPGSPRNRRRSPSSSTTPETSTVAQIAALFGCPEVHRLRPPHRQHGRPYGAGHVRSVAPSQMGRATTPPAAAPPPTTTRPERTSATRARLGGLDDDQAAGPPNRRPLHRPRPVAHRGHAAGPLSFVDVSRRASARPGQPLADDPARLLPRPLTASAVEAGAAAQPLLLRLASLPGIVNSDRLRSGPGRRGAPRRGRWAGGGSTPYTLRSTALFTKPVLRDSSTCWFSSLQVVGRRAGRGSATGMPAPASPRHAPWRSPEDGLVNRPGAVVADHLLLLGLVVRSPVSAAARSRVPPV